MSFNDLQGVILMTRCHLGGVQPLIHFLSEFETVESVLKKINDAHAQLGVEEPLVTIEAIQKPQCQLNESTQEFVKCQLLKMDPKSAVFKHSNHWIQQATAKLESFCDVVYLKQHFVETVERPRKRCKTEDSDGDSSSPESRPSPESVKQADAESRPSPESAKLENQFVKRESPPVKIVPKAINLAQWTLYRKINPCDFDNDVAQIEQWYHILQKYFDNRIMSLVIQNQDNELVTIHSFTLEVPRILEHRSENVQGRLQYMMRKIREMFANEAIWQAYVSRWTFLMHEHILGHESTAMDDDVSKWKSQWCNPKEPIVFPNSMLAEVEKLKKKN